MKMDIIIITKNSVEPCLRKCLLSIIDASSISGLQPRLIIVDGGSTDGTIEMIKEFKDELNPIFLADQGNRATARQKGLDHVETDLFAFIDSDVELTLDWFEEMISHFTDKNVGAVWGAALQTSPKKRKYFEAMARLYGMKPLDMMRKYGEKRGCLHDTMIRRKAIEDIQIPPELHVMEDHYIRVYIEKAGWKWISTVEPYALHHMGKDSPINAYMDAYYGWRLGVYGRGWYIKHLAFSWAKLGYLLLATRDLQVVGAEASKEWQYLKASLKILWEALT